MLASHAAEVTNTWSFDVGQRMSYYTLIDYRADGRAACQLRGALVLIMSKCRLPILYIRFLHCHGSALAVAVCIPVQDPSPDEGILLLCMYIAASYSCKATNACSLQNMVNAI